MRWLLCHKAGLPVIDKRVSLAEALEWDPVIEALAVQEPVWEPGTAHGYHALTYGWLVGEVIRRIDGRSLGTFFAEEIAQPLGLEFWIGLPESEEHRVAPLIGSLLPQGEPPDEEMRKLLEEFTGPDSLLGRALNLNGAFDMECWNSRAVHAAEIGAANGITNARSLSRFYAGLVGPLPDAPSRRCSPRPRSTPPESAKPRAATAVCSSRRASASVSSLHQRSRRTAAPAPSATRGRAVRWALPTPPTSSRRAM